MKVILIENNWLRGLSHGWGNGYVVIPQGSPLHGKHYDEFCELDVHGGLTFSELVDKDHVKNWHDGKSELTEADCGCWIVGFDTCHYGDTPERWTKQDVNNETYKLLGQLIQLEKQLKQ